MNLFQKSILPYNALIAACKFWFTFTFLKPCILFVCFSFSYHNTCKYEFCIDCNTTHDPVTYVTITGCFYSPMLAELKWSWIFFKLANADSQLNYNIFQHIDVITVKFACFIQLFVLFPHLYTQDHHIFIKGTLISTVPIIFFKFQLVSFLHKIH